MKMNNLLRQKHWKLFSIIIILFLISEFTPDIKMTDKISSMIIGLIIYSLELSPFLFILIYFWILTHGLFKKLPNDLKDKKYFKSLFLVSILLSIYRTIAMIDVYNEPFVIFLITGILSLISYSYLILIITRTFHYVNSNSDNNKIAFLSTEYFLFWVFPIGLWILQPKINMIFKNE